MAIEAVKPKHIHCDVIQLFLWFQHRDEQQLEHWHDMERQQNLKYAPPIVHSKNYPSALFCLKQS
jgi:hypothetical protein